MKLRDAWPIYLGMLVAGLAAVVASGLTLAYLASRVGWDGDTRWLLPAAVDVGGASAGWVWLRPSMPAPAQSFGRIVALSCIAGSLAGNAIGHLLRTGLIGSTSAVLVVGVGAVPAAVLAALAHLAALMSAHPASTEATPELPARATETPAPASDPDPIEPTPEPPSGESSIGSGAKPDRVVGKATGSTPIRSGQSATRADPIGSGGTTKQADQSPPAKHADQAGTRWVPIDWVRPSGDDETLIGHLIGAVDRRWISRPITSPDVTAVVAVGRPRDGKLRDLANAALEERDRETRERDDELTGASHG